MKPIRVRVEQNEPIKVRVNTDNAQPVRVKVNSELIRVGDYDHYKGDYSVTPKFENQTLNTKNKAMDFDVDVKSIPIEKVSNPSGGNTIIIGG